MVGVWPKFVMPYGWQPGRGALGGFSSIMARPLLPAHVRENMAKPPNHPVSRTLAKNQLFGKVTVLGDDRTHDGVDMVFCGPFVKACGALPAAVPYAVCVSVRQNGQPFWRSGKPSRQSTLQPVDLMGVNLLVACPRL